MIRLYSEIDLPALILIEKLAQMIPWSEETFKQCLKLGPESWVLEENGQVVGFIILMLQLGECHILNICIHPDYQRKGRGQLLLLHALKTVKSKNVGLVYLEVRRSNQHAIALYKKLGFIEIGDRKGYYLTDQGREDAILYAKDVGVDETL